MSQDLRMSSIYKVVEEPPYLEVLKVQAKLLYNLDIFIFLKMYA
jgi:hypothetical protein